MDYEIPLKLDVRFDYRLSSGGATTIGSSGSPGGNNAGNGNVGESGGNGEGGENESGGGGGNGNNGNPSSGTDFLRRSHPLSEHTLHPAYRLNYMDHLYHQLQASTHSPNASLHGIGTKKKKIIYLQ